MEHVVESLLKVVPCLSMPQAVNIMMQAHVSGVAVVIICALEPAEFYCEGLQGQGLTSTIEPEE
jgi:ATP-dependent Clp protease adaptor protein ClpS